MPKEHGLISRRVKLENRDDPPVIELAVISIVKSLNALPSRMLKSTKVYDHTHSLT